MKSSTDRRRDSSRAGRPSDRKRTVANAIGAGPTDEALKASDLPISVVTELRGTQVPPEQFAAVLSAFGRLSEQGQYDLAVGIISVSKVYELRKLVEKQRLLLPQHQQRERFHSISTSAKRLLALFGVSEAKSVAKGVPPGTKLHPTATTNLMIELYRVAGERRPTATASAYERLTTLILLLSDLAEAAERCALDGKKKRPSRGGNRRAGQITAEVELLQGVIKSYAELRNRFPSSGPRPAFDKRLRQFVRSVLELVATASRFVDSNLPKPSRITDAAIRGAFNRYLHKSKRKP